MTGRAEIERTLTEDQAPTDEHCPASSDAQHCEAWWDGDQCHWCQAPAMPAEERTALGMEPALTGHNLLEPDVTR